MKPPTAITLDCPRCGEELVVPIAIEGPFPDEETGGVFCNVVADVEDIRHVCSSKARPRNKRGSAGPRR